MNGLLENEYGCTGAGCVPECRYYAEYGRLEDEEVVEKHNKFIELLILFSRSWFFIAN